MFPSVLYPPRLFPPRLYPERGSGTPTPTPTPTALPWQFDLVAAFVAPAEDADPFGVDATRTVEYEP